MTDKIDSEIAYAQVTEAMKIIKRQLPSEASSVICDKLEVMFRDILRQHDKIEVPRDLLESAYYALPYTYDKIQKVKDELRALLWGKNDDWA